MRVLRPRFEPGLHCVRVRRALRPLTVREADPTTSRRFLLFTGKGGVGKTTVVAALAVHAASVGRRPLVIELGHRQSMRSVFGVDEIGSSPRDVGGGVHALSIDFDQAVLDYMVEHLPSRRLASAVVSNRVLERLFAAMPAVGEIATMSRLRAFESERKGRVPRWDPILVDLDATGHALMFLELRAVLSGLIGAGPMLRLIESTADMFADPAITRLDLVVTPEELPVSETIELYERLAAAGTVAFGRVIVNRMPTCPLDASPETLSAIERAALAVGEHGVASDVVWARHQRSQEERARLQVERLAERVPLPRLELPRLESSRMSLEDLLLLGSRAAGGAA
jgi:arsenite/tail-anchored protein-transporting ATPase